MINGFLYNSHIFLSSCLHRMAVNFKLYRNLRGPRSLLRLLLLFKDSIHTFQGAALTQFFRDISGGEALWFLRTIFASTKGWLLSSAKTLHHTQDKANPLVLRRGYSRFFLSFFKNWSSGFILMGKSTALGILADEFSGLLRFLLTLLSNQRNIR